LETFGQQKAQNGAEADTKEEAELQHGQQSEANVSLIINLFKS
jgi:hypothetical protein